MLAAAAYTPDDGTQGYTPYFYKMDVPVRVANSISYGRAWQMLRSRGAGSNATGPCDPPQLASSCNCSTSTVLPHNKDLRDDHDVTAMPKCVASPLCDTGPRASSASAPPRGKASILLVLDMERKNLRFPIGTCTACLRRGYGKAVREIIRILLSLRAVNTTLPVHVLASGERYEQVESRLANLFNVSFIPPTGLQSGLPPPLPVPEWASKWAKGSFAKVRALALTQFERLVVLDNDDIVLRNLDHLVDAPAPAFVFGWKCHPRRELRAATMVLRPSLDEWRRASEIAASPSTAIYDDLGEQSVWRRLYSSVHELPAGYAALRTADLSATEWPKVHIVHDAHLIHDVQRAGWHAASMTPVLSAFDKRATKILNDQFGLDFAEPPKAKRRARGKAKAKRGRT